MSISKFSDHKQTIVSNFLSTMDMKLPEQVNKLNAISDSISYNWDEDILKQIMKGIEKIYST